MAVFFEWDRRKEELNLRKHGVAFVTASRVFDDPYLQSSRDVTSTEERWQTIGRVPGLDLLFVVHTVHQDEWEDETIRIISARFVTRKERYAYENEYHKTAHGTDET